MDRIKQEMNQMNLMGAMNDIITNCDAVNPSIKAQWKDKFDYIFESDESLLKNVRQYLNVVDMFQRVVASDDFLI